MWKRSNRSISLENPPCWLNFLRIESFNKLAKTNQENWEQKIIARARELLVDKFLGKTQSAHSSNRHSIEHTFYRTYISTDMIFYRNIKCLFLFWQLCVCNFFLSVLQLLLFIFPLVRISNKIFSNIKNTLFLLRQNYVCTKEKFFERIMDSINLSFFVSFS